MPCFYLNRINLLEHILKILIINASQEKVFKLKLAKLREELSFKTLGGAVGVIHKPNNFINTQMR